ncbi:MAG: hypothetical protein ACREJC_15540, partial [Tepidisphaeraceae bacterium]
MDRIAVTVILVVLLGVWVHPFLSGAKTVNNVTTGDPQRTAQPSPATQPANVRFSNLVGREGFWRLGKSTTGVWWFVSPEGEPQFLNTVTTVQPYQHGRDADGPHFISRDFAGDGQDLLPWAKNTLKRVTAIGFKGLGAWSNPAFHALDVPMARDLNIWTWIKPESKRFYSPGWATTAEQAVKAQVPALRENRNLVGYYLDNELDWGDASSGPVAYFNHLPPDDPNRK